MKKMSCAQAKELDLVDYLASLGHEPAKVRNQDYWYLSPFREEKTPSFKVSRSLKVWYDHGTGQGGDLVDFGILYYRCTIPEVLEKLSQYKPGTSLSFQQSSPPKSFFAGEKKDSPDSKIVVLDTRTLMDHDLVAYLEKRGIPLDLAQMSCREVDFRLYGKQQTAIGFPNRSGGYELRGEYFKGSSAPKDISFIDNGTAEVVVFEGFFNYLSFQTINKDKQAPLTNCLVLNSLSFLEKSRPLMEKHDQIFLALDRDAAGMSHTLKALEWDRDKYIDRSDYYKGRKDLNEWLTHRHTLNHSQDESRRKGRRL
ncbi:MAG: toprim domain-containing protein [Chitinophagaceae bacterium]|nr:toprim domain-containing protein [Chitinophagaceae bacterium]